ncbi:MAG: NAD(P)H-binding protein [Candidatus Saccharibacteria bacterium]
MNRTANIIGDSGLVGQQLLTQLLNHPRYIKVRSFVRRPSGMTHPKLEEIIIDFDQPDSWRMLVQGNALFSTLGTTLKTAGSQENQYRVDFTYQYEFAKAAAQNGVGAYLLVSSMGANPRASVFYSRMKGELEEAVARLSFQKVLVFRPSILEGDRKENRPAEKMGLVVTHFITRFMMKKYRPMPVDLLAEKMIQLSVDPSTGIRTIENNEIFTL